MSLQDFISQGGNIQKVWDEAIALRRCTRELSQGFSGGSKGTQRIRIDALFVLLYEMTFFPIIYNSKSAGPCHLLSSDFWFLLWATAESTLSRNSPLSWEFHHLGGWHSEESRQAGGGRRLPASISASQHLTAALSFSTSILFRNLRILKTVGCIPWERWARIVILMSCSSSFLEVLSTLLAELSEESTV